MAASTADLPTNFDSEQGYEYSGSALFGSYHNGAVWNYQPPLPRDFDAMLARNGKARGLEQVLTLPLRKAPITVVPAKGDNGGAQLVRDALDNMTTPMQLVQAQMCSAITYRQAFFEKVFELVDGKVVLRKLAFRPPQTCAPRLDDKNASFDGFVQRARGTGYGAAAPVGGTGVDDIVIPAQKAFVYVHGAHLRPVHGMSDLEVAFWAHETKQKIRFLWYRWLEVAADGRTAIVNPDLSMAKKVVRTLSRLKGGGLIAVEGGGSAGGTQFQQIPVEPAAAEAYQNAMAWLDQEASSSVLAGFTDLAGAAASGTGSYALSKDQSDFFIMSRQAIADEMGAALTTYVARDLVQWNLGVDAPVPTVTVGPVAEADVVVALSLLETAVGTGQIELPPSFLKDLVIENARNMAMDTTVIAAELDQAIADAKAQKAAIAASVQPAGQPGVVGPDGKPLASQAPTIPGKTRPPGELSPNIAQRSISGALRRGEPKLPPIT